jgi:tetratricopeptide (TPR) repeat protein
VGVGLLVFAVALYFPSTRNDFLYDDRPLILQQPPLGSAADAVGLLSRGYYGDLPYYRPLTAATFAIQKTLHGDDPFPFHLFNVVLAGVVAALAGLLLLEACFGLHPAIAALAAALFVANPVFSSCVDPISGRDTLLAMGFVLGASLAFLRRTTLRTSIGLGLTALGLLTKEAAVVTPALVLLADRSGLSEPRVRGAADWIKRAAPFAAILFAYALIRAGLFAGGEMHVGDLTLVPLSYLYLLQTALVPRAELLYEPTLATWPSGGRLLIVAIFAVGVAIVAAPVWRSVRARVLFWLGWMIVALLPAANLVRQETLFDERYVVLSALALVAIPATVLSERWSGAAARQTLLSVGSVVVLLLAVVSWGRASYFGELTFYRQWSTARPDDVTPQYNLGNALSRRKMFEDAIPAYRAALAVDPTAVRVHYGLALAYASASQVDPAEKEFREVIRLDPSFAEAHDGLGTILAGKGDLTGAEQEFRASLAISPKNANALRNLGYALVLLRRPDEAIEVLRGAIALEPGVSTAHRYLGIALLRSGHAADASGSLREALRLDPTDQEAAAMLRKMPSGGGSTP